MKKVLIIIGKLYIGGAERVARDIGYHADPEKYEVHYLVYGADKGAYEFELEEQGCIIHHMERPSKGYITYYKNLAELLKESHFDVIHSHTMFSSGWVMAAGRIYNVPIRIAHSHTIRGPEKRGLLKNVYENIMRRVVVRNATHLVACGKGAGEWFYGSKVFEARGKLIYNGIYLKEFIYSQDARDSLRSKYQLQDRFVIGHVGHLAPVKNQIFLINLMPQIIKSKQNALLLLLGDGTDQAMLLKRIEELQLEEYVLMTGNVKNVGEFMSAMDVFAFPSLYEGLPLALVEAQTNGLPCLISDCIPTDVHLTDLVKPMAIKQNSLEWIQAICEAKRADSAVYGQLMFEMGFDIQGMVKRIYQLYDGCKEI